MVVLCCCCCNAKLWNFLQCRPIAYLQQIAASLKKALVRFKHTTMRWSLSLYTIYHPLPQVLSVSFLSGPNPINIFTVNSMLFLSVFSFKNGPTRPLFIYFCLFKHKFYNNVKCEKMSIQYMVPGFELMTFWTWVSSHNH